jgi:phosphonate transport system substrate-binding protein
MLYTKVLAVLVGLLLLSACRPNEVILEVTRLVQTQERVEVTRMVPETVVEEATRLVTEEVVIEVTPSPLGSETRPVQLLFAPVVSTDVIATRGGLLAEALSEATGYAFQVGVLDDEQTVIDMMCAAPEDAIGFLSPPGYVVAQEQCDVQAGSVAVDANGQTAQTGMLVSHVNSDVQALEDLAGKRWGTPNADSLPTVLYFEALLAEAGIEPAEIVPFAGESAAMLAVGEEDVDVASAEFIPPILPFDERPWDSAEDDPEPWLALGLEPIRSGIGYIVVLGDPENGGYRVRDARSRVFDVAPQIFSRTGIVALGAPIPNETVAYGRAFPLGLARRLDTLLADFAASEACAESLCSTDFYGWSGLVPVEDSAFAPIRFVRDQLGLSSSDLLGLAEE